MTQKGRGGSTNAEGIDEGQQTGPRAVGLDDLNGVDCEKPLAETKKLCCECFGPLYQRAAEAAEQQGDQVSARVYRLLAGLCQMHFKPEDRAEPYGPLFVMNGRRSIIPDDLRGETSSALAEIAPKIKNSALRARLADLAWLNNKRNAVPAQLAIASYCAAIQRVLDGEGALFFDDERASAHHGSEMLRRACQIANLTGWKEPEAGALKALINTILKRAFDDEDAQGYLNFGTLTADYGTTETTQIAEQAEILADNNKFDPDTSRCLWELAARAYQQCEKDTDSNRCLVSAAECYVRMAAAANFGGMTAASWLMDAIKALRHIPGTKERRQELEQLLRSAQTSISDEMGVVSTKIDLSEVVDHARKAVGGRTLSLAFAEFANLERSPTPEQLRKEVNEQAEKNPLSSIIPIEFHDDEGKVISKSPGLVGGDSSDDTAMRHLIARHEGWRREIAAAGSIEPARRTLQAEHPLGSRHFVPLVRMSPFVPAENEELFAVGFARFFSGDMISAINILVPQLENSLRYVLKQVGIDPSSIQNDMTQENRTISVMLDRDHATLEKIFGVAIVFEIENLFDFREGPALRHKVAHGLLSAGWCYGPDAIYACWFIFRLCCLPLFGRWQDVADVYARLD